LAFKGRQLVSRTKCAGRERYAETEKAHDEQLLVIPDGLARRFVMEESEDLDER